MGFLTLTHCYIVIASLLVLPSQMKNIEKDKNFQQYVSLTNPNNNDEETNSIVIDANTSSTRIINDINNNVNTLIDNQNGVAGNGETTSDLFSQSCVCVPYYLCRENKTIITDGAGVIDIRVKSPTCESYLDICCNSPMGQHEITTEIPNRYPNEKNDGVLTGNSGCGRRNIDGAGVRIKGDVNNEAQFGEFPWMIAVLRTEKVDENNTLNVYQCGGSLIHPRVVMTAAHCVANRDLSTIRVRAGEWDTQTRHERLAHVDQRITQIIVHENYNSGGLFNDIALLITEKPFSLTSHIDTICLPPQNSVPQDVTCTASGWGKDVFGKEGKYQVILKKVDLPIVSRNKCEMKLQTTRLSRFFKLHESFVCAGGEAGRDTCKGDGGGPLVCPTSIKLPSGLYETRYQQGGIVAWGVNCGEDGIPGVYVNVALYKNWIDNWMRQLKFDIRYYTL